MANAWANKRKALYIGMGAALLLIVGTSGIVRLIQKDPTCVDGIQNQDETGVDCGGTCPHFCKELAVAPVVIWSRSFDAKNGFYTSAAMIENQNREAFVPMLSYEFSLYDDKNIFIARKEATGYLLPNGRTLIVASHIETGDRIPVRTEFRYAPIPRWLATSFWMQQTDKLRFATASLTQVTTKPKYQTTVYNVGGTPIKDSTIGAVVYDATGNAIGVSQTVIDRLEAEAVKQITFTWNAPFATPPVKVELIPMIHPLIR